MTLTELKLLLSLIKDNVHAANGHRRMALEIINREIRLKEMDPRKEK